jgi:hypothetical protein
MNTIRSLPFAAAALALTLLAAQPVAADPPAEKGNPQSQKATPAPGGAGKSGDAHERDADAAKSRDAAAGQASGKRQQAHDHGDDPNHGRVVSECNHRANERNLQGKDRKQFTEWCIERGERHQYDDKRYREERSCYQRADDRRLSGDARRFFILDCLTRQGANRGDDDGKRNRN